MAEGRRAYGTGKKAWQEQVGKDSKAPGFAIASSWK
jgi:hypothetical protein